MKVFKGIRDGNYVYVTVNGKPLSCREDLREHSNTFSWGEFNCGSSQLALAITSSVLGDDLALACYHDFKFEVLVRIRIDEWIIDSESVRLWYGTWKKANGKTQDTAKDSANVYSYY